MEAQIEIKRLAVYGHHGALPAEAEIGQRFFIDLLCDTHVSKVVRDDDLSFGVDYGQIVDRVLSLAKGERFQLLETLAYRIARMLLSSFPALTRVRVRVSKPSAPVEAIFDDLAVSVDLRRGA